MNSIRRCVPLFVLMTVGGLMTARAEGPREDTQRKTFEVKPGGRLIIEADRGSITVEGGDVGQATIEVTRKVVRGSDAKAAELLERHRVTMTQEGETLRVKADLEGEDFKIWNWAGPQLEVQVRATVPRRFDLEASTAGGAVRASQLEGVVGLRTSGGSIHAERIVGTLQGKTSGGTIRATRLQGTAELATSGGSIQVQGVEGERLKVSTSGGSIRMEGIAVPTEARTSGGSVTIAASATPLAASTSGGGIDVSLTEAPKSDVVLKTSGGSVSLTLPGSSAFMLDASTSGGGVRSELPVAVTTTDSKERSSLKGPVNGGDAPTIKLRTSGGGIRVKKS